jgi:hypothetical protein
MKRENMKVMENTRLLDYFAIQDYIQSIDSTNRKESQGYVSGY